MNRHKLAVYGTLKKGFGNYPVLGTNVKLIGIGKTANPYWMPDMGNGAPVVTKEPAMAPIHVEVYEVDESQLTGPLDWIENNGINYTREITPIIIEGDVTVDAWLYFHNRPAKYWDDEGFLENHPPVDVFNWHDAA